MQDNSKKLASNRVKLSNGSKQCSLGHDQIISHVYAVDKFSIYRQSSSWILFIYIIIIYRFIGNSQNCIWSDWWDEHSLEALAL